MSLQDFEPCREEIPVTKQTNCSYNPDVTNNKAKDFDSFLRYLLETEKNIDSQVNNPSKSCNQNEHDKKYCRNSSDTPVISINSNQQTAIICNKVTCLTTADKSPTDIITNIQDPSKIPGFFPEYTYYQEVKAYGTKINKTTQELLKKLLLNRALKRCENQNTARLSQVTQTSASKESDISRPISVETRQVTDSHFSSSSNPHVQNIHNEISVANLRRIVATSKQEVDSNPQINNINKQIRCLTTNDTSMTQNTQHICTKLVDQGNKTVNKRTQDLKQGFLNQNMKNAEYKNISGFSQFEQSAEAMSEITQNTHSSISKEANLERKKTRNGNGCRLLDPSTANVSDKDIMHLDYVAEEKLSEKHSIKAAALMRMKKTMQKLVDSKKIMSGTEIVSSSPKPDADHISAELIGVEHKSSLLPHVSKGNVSDTSKQLPSGQSESDDTLAHHTWLKTDSSKIADDHQGKEVYSIDTTVFKLIKARQKLSTLDRKSEVEKTGHKVKQVLQAREKHVLKKCKPRKFFSLKTKFKFKDRPHQNVHITGQPKNNIINVNNSADVNTVNNDQNLLEISKTSSSKETAADNSVVPKILFRNKHFSANMAADQVGICDDSCIVIQESDSESEGEVRFRNTTLRENRTKASQMRKDDDQTSHEFRGYSLDVSVCKTPSVKERLFVKLPQLPTKSSKKSSKIKQSYSTRNPNIRGTKTVSVNVQDYPTICSGNLKKRNGEGNKDCARTRPFKKCITTTKTKHKKRANTKSISSPNISSDPNQNVVKSQNDLHISTKSCQSDNNSMHISTKSCQSDYNSMENVAKKIRTIEVTEEENKASLQKMKTNTKNVFQEATEIILLSSDEEDLEADTIIESCENSEESDSELDNNGVYEELDKTVVYDDEYYDYEKEEIRRKRGRRCNAASSCYVVLTKLNCPKNKDKIFRTQEIMDSFCDATCRQRFLKEYVNCTY